ncbi:C45 family peptidase [Rhodoferax sp.]|uniref:C45 family autoproteolytic acyltransferase/hydolase n=1 Tax=Rhodoferax sp. TaxID=50421 RepID=UPI0026081103|nr:C45 family peptidase [Rhodoferax sp.]MDD2920409.1 C45 family autoproteolytic acyltransferase/hydrolase [Rhodoferax sp.]
MPEPLSLVRLVGSAMARGQQQALARPELVQRVRAALLGRLASVQDTLEQPRMARYLKEQKEFLAAQDRPGFDESLGLATGFGLTHDEVLAYLHANVLVDMSASTPIERDGCTSWAHIVKAGGALVVKNRDYRGEHGALQQAFLHSDPAANARTLLCVGSLGSPGAFSSGINSAGLAVVDTQIGTRDHGVGWLRYFLMTALLRECPDVDAALAFIAAVPHAGGGSLVLGDACGTTACVALGHAQAPVITRSTPSAARTNHYLDPQMAARMVSPCDDLSDSSPLRLAQVQSYLAQHGNTMDVAKAQALMASHQEGASICLHADAGSLTQARTLSCVVYETASQTLHITNGNPCNTHWNRFALTELAASTFKHPA